MALLKVKGMSEWLQVKRSTIYLWAEQGLIPHLKLGRLLRFDSDEIEAWLQTHRQEVTTGPTLPRRRHGIDHVDALIAAAKREVYTSCHGKPDQGRATRKGDSHGSV